MCTYFWYRYVPPTFSKVGSLELIFCFETQGIVKKFFAKIWVSLSQELKFSQNQRKLSFKMRKFSKNIGIVFGDK